MHNIVSHYIYYLCISINCSRNTCQKIQALSYQRWVVLTWHTYAKIIIIRRLEHITTCLIFKQRQCTYGSSNGPLSIAMSISSTGRYPSNAARSFSKIYRSLLVSSPSAEWRECSGLHVALNPFYHFAEVALQGPLLALVEAALLWPLPMLMSLLCLSLVEAQLPSLVLALWCKDSWVESASECIQCWSLNEDTRNYLSTCVSGHKSIFYSPK
jgi:hypothetical protein